jgi:hypothetical protein
MSLKKSFLPDLSPIGDLSGGSILTQTATSATTGGRGKTSAFARIGADPATWRGAAQIRGHRDKALVSRQEGHGGAS